MNGGKERFANLRTRVISAAVLAPPVLLAVYAGGIWFTLLAGAAMLLMLEEWYRLTEAPPSARFFLYGAGILTLIPLFTEAWMLALAPAAAFAAVTLLAGLTRTGTGRSKSRWTALGLFYILLPVIALVMLREATVEGRSGMFWLLGVVWATDIGGYVFGKLIDGPKLAPRISPGKTWAGLGGAVLFAGLTGAGFAWGLALGTLLPLAFCSMVLAVIAQMGDLFESWVKRRFGKKDAGGLIPGHGGLLDRVDGLLAAAAVLWLLVWSIGLFQPPASGGRPADMSPQTPLYTPIPGKSG